MRRVVSAIVLLAAVSAAGPVGAQTDQRGDEPPPADRADAEFDRLVADTLAEIDRRLAALDAVAAALENSQHLTPRHRQELEASLAESIVGLRELRVSVDGATNLRELRDLVPRIVTDHWVFVWAVPRAYEVMAADALVAVGAELSAAHEAVGAAVARAASAGLDVSASRSLLEQARVDGERGVATAAGVSERALGVTVGDLPGGVETLVRAAADLRVAAEDLRSAVAATRAAVDQLRQVAVQSTR